MRRQNIALDRRLLAEPWLGFTSLKLKFDIRCILQLSACEPHPMTLPTAVSLVTAAAFGVVALDHTRAADLDLDQIPPAGSYTSTVMRVISRDETSRFMWLGINKSMVFELPRDIKEVLVGSKGGSGAPAGGGGTSGGGTAGSGGTSGGSSPEQTSEIVKVVVLSNRRVNIIGASRGRTNVYFYDANGRQIGALDIAVTNDSSPAPFDVFGRPVNTLVIYYGGNKDKPSIWSTLACTDSSCSQLPVSRDDTDTALATARAGGNNTTSSTTNNTTVNTNDASGSGAAGGR